MSTTTKIESRSLLDLGNLSTKSIAKNVRNSNGCLYTTR